MRMRHFVPGLAVGVAAAALIAGTVGAGSAASSEASPGKQQLVGAPKHGQERVPAVGRRWAAAWTTGDTRDLARLYTRDAVYTDRALNLVFRGSKGVEEWETGSRQLIENLKFEATGGFRGGDGVVVEGVFSGRIVGAPRPFAVPLVTVLRLRGNLIQSSNDYYNRGEIVSESGLPADWAPPGS
ncbi:nuclear transport factor 2 family protein [Streptomyces sp. EMB24]|uniref:nuclear transport factor 2 family protein n=1 Tax=Streptomyces sp. EMB24 TaxID=2835531 RepID=UPI00227CC0D7|nr:nuclear transport factor 2 family protein [Streptomyces sp. EMB24]